MLVSTHTVGLNGGQSSRLIADSSRKGAIVVTEQVNRIPSRRQPRELTRAAVSVRPWMDDSRSIEPVIRRQSVDRLVGALRYLESRCNEGRFQKTKHEVRDQLRAMLKEEGREVAPLNRVHPQQFLFKTWPCQQTAAIERNDMVKAMERGDALQVARLYVASRGGHRWAFAEASVGMLAGAVLCALGTWKGIVAAAAGAAAGVIAIPLVIAVAAPLVLGAILLRNERRTDKTRRGAEMWLADRFGQDGLEEIKKLSWRATCDQIGSVLQRHRSSSRSSEVSGGSGGRSPRRHARRRHCEEL